MKFLSNAQNAIKGANASHSWHKRSFIALILFGAIGMLSACNSDKILGLRSDSILNFGEPTGVTPQAIELRHFWTATVVLSLFVGGIVWFMIAYFMVHYRKRKDSPEFPQQIGYNSFLEITYTIIPIIIVLTLFVFTVKVESFVDKLVPNPPVVVDVTAFKWNWKFGYNTVKLPNYTYYGAIDPDHPDVINPYRGISPEEIEKNREARLRENQAHGNEISLAQLKLDRIETIGNTTEVPVLVLPIDTRIEFRLSSADVVHSFYIPEFLFKRDVFPFPYAERSQFRFQISRIDRTGYFVGRCAAMCGEYHSAMNFEVRAVSVDNFEKYLDARRAGDTNAQALIAIHTPGVAQATRPFEDL